MSVTDPRWRAAVEDLSKDASLLFFPMIKDLYMNDPKVEALGVVVALTIKSAYERGLVDGRDGVTG